VGVLVAATGAAVGADVMGAAVVADVVILVCAGVLGSIFMECLIPMAELFILSVFRNVCITLI